MTQRLSLIGQFRSAIGAASNGSRVCDINSNDIAWLSQLVGMNLDTNQTASQLPVETTAERLSRLYHTSEQVTISHIYDSYVINRLGVEYNASGKGFSGVNSPTK